SRRVAFDRSEIALTVHQRLAHRPSLRHVDEGGVDHCFAVGVIVTARVAANFRAFPMLPAREERQIVHRVENSALRWFQTISRIGIVNILSASTALSSFKSTLSSLRFSGFIVVSNNSFAFISPRPLNRLICTPRRPISKIFSRISGMEKSGCETAFSPSPSINS